MRFFCGVLILTLLTPFTFATGSETNKWVKIVENEIGPGFSPGLIYSPELKKFISIMVGN